MGGDIKCTRISNTAYSALCYTSCHYRAEPKKIIQVRQWLSNSSTHKSNLIIKFCKNLFKFILAVLSPKLITIGSAQPEQDVQTRATYFVLKTFHVMNQKDFDNFSNRKISYRF